MFLKYRFRIRMPTFRRSWSCSPESQPEVVAPLWQKFKQFLKQAQLRYWEADLDHTIYAPTRKPDMDTVERPAKCTGRWRKITSWLPVWQAAAISIWAMPCHLCISSAKDSPIHQHQHPHARTGTDPLDINVSWLRNSTIIIFYSPIKTWFDLFCKHTYAETHLARITDKF